MVFSLVPQDGQGNSAEGQGMGNSEQPTAEQLTRDQVQPRDTTGDASPNQEVTPWEFPGARYQVVGEIGRGGMGVVLRAYDVSFGRPLAIKLLLQYQGPGGGDERRFLEEARITGQ